MIELRVAFDSISTSKSQILLSYTQSVKFNTLCDEHCQFFQMLTALGLGFLGCTEIYTPSLSLTGFKRAQLFPSSPSLGPRSFATRSRKGLVLAKNRFEKFCQKLTKVRAGRTSGAGPAAAQVASKEVWKSDVPSRAFLDQSVSLDGGR